MRLYKLWQRRLLWEFTLTWLSFLLGFAALFIVVDYASGTATWRQLQGTTPLWAMVTYYLSEVIIYAEILLPFAALFATIKTMLRLNDSNELLALRCGGLSLKKISAPLIIAGFLMTCLLLLNNEMLRPQAESFLSDIEGARRLAKYKHREWATAHNVPTAGGGNVFYLSYIEDKSAFKEAYWVQSDGTIIKMHELYPFNNPPEALWAEVLRRNDEGDLELTASYASLTLDGLAIIPEALRSAALQPHLMPISSLWRQAQDSDSSQSMKEASLVTLYYKRLAMPWLALLAIAAPLPWCTLHRRLRRSAALYGGALFALVTLYLLLDAAGILGSRQLINPLFAIATPLLLAAVAVIKYYWRLR